ncbi:molybdopterin-guanine dinucleotide biosynthesis protein B [Mesoterricola silvestris]|uniref:Molybdopterin-guanine dinucleotide biosynthesis protein B n=1 Tax=Mesoterricola silvestris TaxID=2927979 RepID=A0AA48K8W4_9BACT|nr:molybdopterin-guanine dinucleotide biosynthesis protein B [Mesoterricola silvestris]BDU71707.1 molybdopterin-guanine dinucleotide biosynthesis protein B [Mesoterricola silvestris]
MKVMGIVGWSGSGKTSLLVQVLPLLRARGLRVSTMKHAHHRFDVDRPGKDSFQHREAGASEVLVVTSSRWVLMHESREEPEPSIESLIQRMTPVDLLLIEGFKTHPHPKLEIHRKSEGRPLLCPGDPDIVAVATDQPLPDLALPQLDLNDPAAIADFILAHTGLA